MLKTSPTTYTIAQYCDMLERRQIVVNSNYQRSPQVWPAAAKSNLIDTILTGYPIPKIILSQKTDLETRKTLMEVVDGQQRTHAIREFFKGQLRLSRGDFSGLTFEELEDDKKHEFLDYVISADIFASATEEDIREVFRRINSYQVPLNYQEHRHAVNQGEFKWFIHGMGQRYTTALVKLGAVNERKVSRMADLETLTELAQLLMVGIRTASQSALNKLYADNDKTFPQRAEIEQRLDEGLGYIIGLPEIHNTELTSRPNLYSLFAAVVALKFDLPQLDPEELGIHGGINENRETVVVNLTTLLSALGADEGARLEQFSTFITASKAGTNTVKNRTLRYEWLCRALTADRL
jgi:Protein of unknown function DUF262